MHQVSIYNTAHSNFHLCSSYSSGNKMLLTEDIRTKHFSINLPWCYIVLPHSTPLMPTKACMSPGPGLGWVTGQALAQYCLSAAPSPIAVCLLTWKGGRQEAGGGSVLPSRQREKAGEQAALAAAPSCGCVSRHLGPGIWTGMPSQC